MSPALRDLVRRPSTFFADAPESPPLVGPALVALAIGLSGVVRLLLLLEVLGDVAPGFSGDPLVYAVGQLAVAAPQSLVLASVLTLVLFLVGWVIAAGVVYLVSLYFEPEGSFRRLLAFVGWGQFPTLVPAVAATVYIAWAVLTGPDIATEAAAESWIRSTFVENPVQSAIELAGFPFAVWSAYLWLLAAEHGLGLSRRRALVCVALPVLVLVGNSIGGFVTLTG